MNQSVLHSAKILHSKDGTCSSTLTLEEGSSVLPFTGTGTRSTSFCLNVAPSWYRGKYRGDDHRDFQDYQIFYHITPRLLLDYNQIMIKWFSCCFHRVTNHGCQ